MDGETYAMFDTLLNVSTRDKLINSGHRVISFPVPDIRTIAKPLPALDNFEWIVFTDIFAVDAFVEIGSPTDDLHSIRVCAVGDAVADGLRSIQVHSDVIPLRSSPLDVVAAVAQYESGLDGMPILLVAGTNTFENLAREFETAGAEVTVAAVYKASIVNPAEGSRLRACLIGGAVDKFFFSCPEDLLRLRISFNAEPVEILSGVTVVVPDGTTFRTASENGLHAEIGPKIAR